MKRMLVAIITSLLLVGSFAASTVPAFAANDSGGAKQAAACKNQFNGKTFLVGSTGLKNFQAACSGGSGCTTKNIAATKKKKASVKITCNGQSTDDTSSGVGSDTSNPCESNNFQATGISTQNSGDTADNSTGQDGASDTTVVNNCDPAVTTDCSTNGCNIIDNFINPTITALSVLVGLAVTVGIIMGAIQVASSGGDPQQNAKGKKHIRDAIIGLVSYLLLFFFLQFVIPGV